MLPLHGESGRLIPRALSCIAGMDSTHPSCFSDVFSSGALLAYSAYSALSVAGIGGPALDCPSDPEHAEERAATIAGHGGSS